MATEKAGTLVEKRPKFNPENFRVGNFVSYYHDGRWQEGKLIRELIIEDDKISIAVDGVADWIELGAPPKKIELPTIPHTVLDGKEYRFHPNGFYLDKNDGTPLLDLTEVTTGKKILGVDASLLYKMEIIGGEAAKKIEDARGVVESVAGMRRKELLAIQIGIEKKFKDLLAQFGAPENWPESDAQEVAELGEAVGKIGREIEALSLGLRRAAEAGVDVQEKNQRAEEAKKQTERLTRLENIELKEPRREYEKAKKAREEFLATKKTWDEWKKLDNDLRKWESDSVAFKSGQGGGGSGGRGGKGPKDPGTKPRLPGQEPTRPDGVEPPEPTAIDEGPHKLKAGFGFYNSLPADDKLREEIEKRRRKEAERLELGSDYPEGKPNGSDDEKKQYEEYREETVKILREVLAEWVGQAEKEPAKFDFEKERIELENKIISLEHEADEYHDAIVDDKIRQFKASFKSLDKAAAKADNFVDPWKLASDIEVDLYARKLSRSGSAGREVKEREINVSQSLWRKILAGRESETHELFKSIYESSKEDGSIDRVVVVGAMKRLFKKSPDENTLRELRACGIRSWEGFLARLDGGFGDTLSAALVEMAQDHLRREVARKVNESRGLDEFGAAKGDTIVRGAVAAVVTCSAAVALMEATDTPQMARWLGNSDIVRRLAGGIGGAIGGLFSGAWDILIGRRKDAKEDMAKRMAKLEADKKKELSPEIARGFEVEETAAILSELTRETSAKPLADTESSEAKRLNVNARRLYIDALRKMELAGKNPDAEGRRALAIALLELQAETRQKAIGAVVGADSAVVEVMVKLVGDRKFFSGDPNGEGLVACALQGGLVGLGLSGDWMTVLAGGSLAGVAGYSIGEIERKMAERQRGIEEVEKDVKAIMDFYALRSEVEETRPELARLEAQFEAVRTEWEDISSQIAKKHTALFGLEPDLDGVLKQLNRLNSELADLRKNHPGVKGKQEKAGLQEKLDREDEAIRRLTDQLSSIDKDVTVFRRRKDAIGRDIDYERGRLTEFRRELESLDESDPDFRRKKDAFLVSIEDKMAAIKRLNTDLDDLNKDNPEVKRKKEREALVKEKKKKEEARTKLVSVLEGVNRVVSGFERREQELTEDIGENVTRRDAVSSEMRGLRADIDSLEVQIHSHNILKQQVDGIKDKGNRLVEEESGVADLILKLKAALRGGRMEEVEDAGGTKVKKQVEEQWYVLALQENPVLRRLAENLVYEAEEDGLLVELREVEELDRLLQKLAERSHELEEQSQSFVAGGGKWRTATLTAVGGTAGTALMEIGSRLFGY